LKDFSPASAKVRAMGVRVAYLVTGLAVAACLGALIGCGGGGTFNSGTRAPWRGEREQACLTSGVLRASSSIQPMSKIDGPGVCGLDVPLKVSGLSGGRVGVQPAATIGCPLTAGLDRWMQASVQPAAIRYFGEPVVSIRQIASYSCRGRNGNNYGHISEHAFGNALDIAGFRLASGEEVSVVKGWWKGSRRERAFLQTVIAGACSEFYTVLGPGSDRHHYNHIHVDLLVKNARNGRHYCSPSFRRGIPVAEAEADPSSTASVKPIPFVGPAPGED
jgi:hypothetical protein